MRKVYISLVVAVFAVFVSSTLILAKEGSDDSNRFSSSNSAKSDSLENREKILEKNRELKDRLKEKEASKMAEVRAKVQQNLTKRLSNVNRHLGAYLERLDKIAAKIDSRIKKLKAKGVDTSGVQTKLAEALVLGGLARSAVNSAKVDIASAKDKASVESAMASVKSAQKALFAYHKGLVGALRELKVANGAGEGSGSAKEGDK